MDIAIIGAGNVSKALAANFARNGHAVVITATDPESASSTAERLGVRAAASNRDAIEGAQVVVIAVPFAAARELAREIAPWVEGKIVVDATNPLTPTYDGLVTEGGPSAAERLATWLPGARVVKAFNTLFAANQLDPTVDGIQLDAFVAADDPEARRTVLELAESIGLRPIDVGPLSRARELEALAFLNIKLQATLGNSWQTGWKLVGVPAGAIESPRVAAAAGH